MRRGYRGAVDLRAMQVAVQRVWSPHSRWHVGDLAWGRFQHVGREPDWPTALWTDPDGRVLAWGWAELPGHLDLFVDPAHPELAVEVLAWFDGIEVGAVRTVTVLDAETYLMTALSAAGYRADPDAPFLRHCAMALQQLPRPVLPNGFRTRHVLAQDVERRAAVHRAAFAPSRVTGDSYRIVTAAWPYRSDLDIVVEGPDGEFAAFALAWFDEQHRVGELEPVGVDPRYRRRGLGRAVSAAALHALRRAGADSAVVYPRGDAEYLVPLRLYRSLGFAPVARTVTFRDSSATTVTAGLGIVSGT